MPYTYLEEIAIADIAFRATGKTQEELFAAAADATVNVMVEDLATIRDRNGSRYSWKTMPSICSSLIF